MNCSIKSYSRCGRTRKVGPLAIGIFAGVVAIVAAIVIRRRAKDCTSEGIATEKEGSAPHTDFDAAAAIGRETGGEVFDD